MITRQVAKNIYRISVPIPNNPLRELNSYLIRDPERDLLIDTGFRLDACREALLAGLAELHVDPKELDIFVTHLHADHSGLAPEMIGPGRKIYVSAIDREWLQDGAVIKAKWLENVRRFAEADMPQYIIDEMSVKNPAITFAPPPGCAQYVSVSSGDILRVGGYELECILTPGHTPGHMCLLDVKRKLMFTGDHVLFDITPNITTWPGFPNSLRHYLNSLREMKAYDVEIALPGHRKTSVFAQRVEELLTHHTNRLNETKTIIRSFPGMTACQIAGHMTWSIHSNDWENFLDTQKIFAVGECMAHLDDLLAQGIIKVQPVDGKYHYFSTEQR